MTQQEPQRADAVHNRERIIEVARHALAESAGASLNSIAKQAGVGAGTLYRHFPDRESLVLAVYQEQVRQLADAAPALLARHPPLDALRQWCGELRQAGSGNPGLAAALHGVTSDRLADPAFAPVTNALAGLLAAAEQASVVRAGLRPDDVLLLLGFLRRTVDGPGAGAQSGRILELVLGGLAAPAAATPAARRARRFWRRSRSPQLATSLPTV